MYLVPGCEMTPRGFNARGFFPFNTKWAGSSAISGQRRRKINASAGPFYGNRRQVGLQVQPAPGRLTFLGQEDVSYSPLPDLETPDFSTPTPLILIPSSAGDVTSSTLPDTLTPPASNPSAPPSILNLATSATPSLLQTIFGGGTSVVAAATKPGAPTVRRTIAVAPGSAGASVLSGVSGNTLLWFGGGLLLLTAIRGRR